MRSFLVISFATFASLGLIQFKAPPALAAPPVYSWTGAYVGLNAGGGWGKLDTTSSWSPIINANGPQYTAMASPSFDSSFFTGGGQVGYNYQIGAIVLGVEADFEAFRVRGSFGPTTYVVATGGATETVSSSFSTNWLFTGRGRIGFVNGPWLFYGTGGVAVTKYSYQAFSGDSIGETEFSNLSTTKTGYAAGGGVEYAWSPNWMIRAEYLHVGFSGASVSTVCTCIIVPGTVFTHSLSRLDADIGRVAVSYKF